VDDETHLFRVFISLGVPESKEKRFRPLSAVICASSCSFSKFPVLLFFGIRNESWGDARGDKAEGLISPASTKGKQENHEKWVGKSGVGD